ncbi:hypothetical protein KP509_07G091000 [Ceratopteris richardii]|uniref:1-phosphatidylinositol-3-phosphate 5-kinase n=1 Tax=Ceratopteris richardii TaxID=49495 RepID=A0A8T2UK91_CERRI|nr:hypothetical protein KP509_07G091000 [Ceratopteris richardii]KAH7433885.1 hypothetical protein KP509_07G091000 [Ceratopteris richardii]
MIPFSANGRSLSPRGRDDSPSPYDFCNDSRSDEDIEVGESPRSTGLRPSDSNTMESKGDMHTDNVSSNQNTVGPDRKEDSQCSELRPEPSVCQTEEPEPSLEEDSSCASLYTEPLAQTEKYLPLDIENNTSLWVAPPPEDKNDEFGVNEDDNDADLDAWSLSNSLGRGKDSLPFEQRKDMKAVVTGHFRVVVAQLLGREGVSMDENSQESWLDIVTLLSLQAASIVKPDTSLDGGMDPGKYVKIKYVANGKPSESRVVRGVVCKNNVAHKRMTSKFKDPRILILGGSLEFHTKNHLTSLGPVLKQEEELMKKALSKIETHNPQILFVEKAVSCSAQERLLEKGISLVRNVKRSLLERIAKCTGATIAPSLEQSPSAKVGHCGLFHVEKYQETLDGGLQGGKAPTKTLVFLEDCPKPLGCSILLKGSSCIELEKVKNAVKLAVFAAYHLALETSFLVDEGIRLPELCLESQLSVALPDKKSKSELSISTVAQNNDSNLKDGSFGDLASQTDAASLASSSRSPSPSSSSKDLQSGDMIRTFTAGGDSELVNSTEDLSATMPMEYLKQNAFGFVGSARDVKPAEDAPELSPVNQESSKKSQSSDKKIQTDSGSFSSINSDNQSIYAAEEEKGPSRSMPVIQVSSQLSPREDVQCLKHEDFPPSPSNHQSILVSYSSSCLKKGTVCERGHLFRIKYYGTFDKPLGRFLQETLFDRTNKCPACGELKDAHVDCYTHRQGSLTISVHEQNESLGGKDEGKIWMWHRCLKCPRVDGIPPATHRVVMSDAAWGLSFGKFLELSFSNHASASRVASCGHSLHRDCLRFYGFGRMVACIRYSPVHVYTVYLPPSELDFCYFEHQEWLLQEMEEIAKKGDDMFNDILRRLQHVHDNEKDQEVKGQISELKELLSKQKDCFQRALNAAALRRGGNQPHADILRLNFIRRSLASCLNSWDKRMQGLSTSLKSSKSLPVFDSGMFVDSLPSFLSFGNSRSNLSNGSKEISVAGSPKRDFQGFSSEKSKSMDGLLPGNHGDPNSKGLEPCASLPVDTTKTAESIEIGEMFFPDNSSSGGNAYQPGFFTTSVNSTEGGFGVHKSFSEDHFSTFENVSATLDAAWIGENQSESELSSDMLLNEKEKENAELEDFVGVSRQSSSDTSEEGSPVYSPQDLNLSGDFCLTSTLTSAAKTGEVSDIEGWVGAPYSSFQSGYNVNADMSTPIIVSKAEGHPSSLPAVSSVEQGKAKSGVVEPLFSEIEEPVVSVYDDEPTTVIAFAIISHEHQAHLAAGGEKQREKDKDHKDRDPETLISVLSGGFSHLLDGRLDHSSKQGNSVISTESKIDPLLDSRASHLKVNFSDDAIEAKTRYTVTCYYAKQFDSLRKRCCRNDLDFIRSLCRCKKWRAQGGKSNVFFAKTADDRFIVKQVTKTELDSFMTFAPAYFKYISDAIGTKSPTCLAKILGIYQVTVKHVKGGREIRMDMMIMENLLYGRHVTRVYDLKGSLRSRYNADAAASDAVLLDQNLLESLQTNPIYISNRAKRLLERAVWNDTAFLASVDVMDYSMLVGVDEGRQELVLGIIDFMRQYTWDKHLETWVKASGILGGPKNAAPTVISPKEYKKRFRKAMSTYFLMVPDQWSPSTVISGVPYHDKPDDSPPASSGDLS